MALQRRACVRGQFYLLPKVCGGHPGPASISREEGGNCSLCGRASPLDE